MAKCNEKEKCDEHKEITDTVGVDITIEVDKDKLLYEINDVPPLNVALVSALQQALLAISGSFGVTLIIAELICATDDEILKSTILSCTMFMTGICTLLQSTVGIRMPLYQGPSANYLAPLLGLLTLPEWSCVDIYSLSANTNNNATNITLVDPRSQVYPKIQRLQIPLMISGIIHALLGATGLVGFLLRYVGPVTIVPTLLLMGLYVVKVILRFSQTNWGISLGTATFCIILSLYLRRYKTPIPAWNRNKGFHIFWYPLHSVFSMLFAIIFGWILSTILTAADLITNPKARTDTRNHVIAQAGWIYLPYPGQFGIPKFNVGAMVSFMIATIASILDSIADYEACAKISKVPRPPPHGVNRGILIEGIATFLAGTFGIGHGTSTYGGNIGAIGISKVASRRVFQLVGVIYILMGLFGKLGAVFTTIPYCVIGGIQMVYFGSLIGVVLTNLQNMDLASTRNVSIIGISLLMGVALPEWFRNNSQVFNTGYIELDNSLKTIAVNPNFLGGLLAFILDNSVPGNLSDRGIFVENNEDTESLNYKESDSVYGIPYFDRISHYPILRYVPFLQSYGRPCATENKQQNDAKLNDKQLTEFSNNFMDETVTGEKCTDS